MKPPTHLLFRILSSVLLCTLAGCIGVRTGPPDMSGPPTEHSKRAAPAPAPGEGFRAPAEEGAAGDGLKLTAPPAWKSIEPASPMRRAQWLVPGAGSSGEAEATLFFFGSGQGGSVTANLERWKGQFTRPDGSPAGADARVERRTASGIPVTVLDISGTYSGGGMAAAGDGGPEPGYRMFAAVFELPGGAWFLRLLGPAESVNAATADFNSVVETAQRGPLAR